MSGARFPDGSGPELSRCGRFLLAALRMESSVSKCTARGSTNPFIFVFASIWRTHQTNRAPLQCMRICICRRPANVSRCDRECLLLMLAGLESNRTHTFIVNWPLFGGYIAQSPAQASSSFPRALNSEVASILRNSMDVARWDYRRSRLVPNEIKAKSQLCLNIADSMCACMCELCNDSHTKRGQLHTVDRETCRTAILIQLLSSSVLFSTISQSRWYVSRCEASNFCTKWPILRDTN